MPHLAGGRPTPPQRAAHHLEGDRQAFVDFMGLLDRFPFWFNIVTP